MGSKECIHCGSPIPTRLKDSEFCCTGCEFVYKLIHEFDLDRYYKLKDRKTSPLLGLFQKNNNLEWLDRVVQETPGVVSVQVKGVQCAACVWLIGELAKKMGDANVSVNTAYGRMKIRYDPSSFDLKAYLMKVQNFGYVISPQSDGAQEPQSKSLLLRLGICSALSMNVMMFSASIYTGLSADNNPALFFLITHINAVIATLALVVGGSYFVKRAYLALRSGLLHFDLPIALGILLAYTGSMYVHVKVDASASYFDTVTIFITLMLAGRLIQQRMIEKNKNQIVQQDEITSFTIRRKINDSEIEDVSFHMLAKDDQVIVPVGTIFPVDAVASEEIEVDLSWINGESRPVAIEVGKIIPAGSTLLGPHAVTVECKQGYDDTELSSLLTQAQSQEALPRVWQAISSYYVLGVLFLVCLGFAIWCSVGGISQAISVAVSIAVITCPCSLGLAIPLAKTIAYRILMKHGVLIQKPHTLDFVQMIENVAFDKTGTITLSELYWSNESELNNIDKNLLSLLYSATSKSYHPASRAIFERLQLLNLPYVSMNVNEVVGQGLEFDYQGKAYRVGRGLDQNLQKYTVSVLCDEKELLQIHLEEVLQENMKEVVQVLQQLGKNLYIISGDQSKRVEEVANEVGIAKDHVYASCSPSQKQAIMQKLSSDLSMYIGDGLNDQLALSEASVSALSLHTQLQLVQEAHLYFLSQSMDWLPVLFAVSNKLRKTVRFNLGFLVVYNTVAVGSAMMGWITPLICAVIMPLSSLFVIGWTLINMKKTDVNHMGL